MSEPNSSPSSDDPAKPIDPSAPAGVKPAEQPTALPPKPLKRRRWRWAAAVVGVLLLLGALLIGLTPSLASMGWARAIVVEQINKNINGKVEIEDYSASWTGGLNASRIRVYDADSELIAEVGSVSTQLSLLDAMRGRFNCGETTIAGVGFTLKQYPDGSTNFDRLLKQTKPTPSTPASPAAKTKEPLKLPPVRIHFRLTDCHGVVERKGAVAAKSQVIDFDAIDADVNITDINSPINHSLKIVARVDNGKSQGTITENGTLAVIQNDQLDPKTAAIKESVALSNFDLAGAAPFLPASVRQLTGITNGNIDVDVASGKTGTIGAALDVQKPTMALASFQANESLPLDRVSLSLPQPTTIDLSAGMEHWADWVFKVGDGHTQQITLFAEKDGAKLFNLTIAADVTAGQIMDLAANRKPTAGAAAAGRVEVIAHADPGKLCQLLPKTMAVKDGVELTSAPLQCTLSADFSQASSSLSQSFDLTDVKGRNTIEKRDISIQPFHLACKGTTFGGGWQMPDLRDLSLVIQHGQGMNADFHGPDLASVNGTLRLKMREILAEAAQFIDLDNKQADGDVTATATASGDLAGGPAGSGATRPAVSSFQLDLTARDLKLAGFGESTGQVFAQQFVGVNLKGEVDRDRAGGQVDALKGVSLVARAGDEAQPNIAADLEAKLVSFQNVAVTDPATGKSSTIRAASIPEFKTNKLGIADLKLAQADFGAFLPFLKDVRIEHGSVSLAGTSGSYDGVHHMLDFGVFPRIDELTASSVSSAPTTAPVSPTAQVLTNYSLIAAVGGKLSSDDGMTRLTLSNLSITDSPQWLSIARAGDAPLEVAIRPDGTMSAQGGIKLGVELAPFSDMAAKFAAAPPDAAAPRPMKLTRGRLESTFTLAKAQADAIGLSVDLDANGLTVSGDGPGVNNESLRVVLRASAAGDLSNLAVSQLDATGSVVTAHVPKAVIWLKSGAGKEATPVLQMLRELSAKVDVPDTGKLQAMLDALSPAAPPNIPAQATPGTPPPPPVHAKLTGGSLAVKLDVTNKDNQLTFIPDVQGKGLAFAAGTVKYKLGDVSVKAKAIVVADAGSSVTGPDGQSQPIIRQISQLLIPELLATAAGSTIALAGQPIVINDPADLSDAFAAAGSQAAPGQAAGKSPLPPGKSPSINATVSIAGDLPALINLFDALAGQKPAPSYLGTYSFQQSLVTQNGIIKADGKGSIQNFAVLDTDHKTPTFNEKTVSVESSLAVDDTHGPTVLTIGKLRFAMESSKAFDLNFAGTVNDLSGQRVMDHVIADVSYDGEQLTPILRSMLAPRPTPAEPNPVNRFKDLRMAGKKTERFQIWGSYPANQPFEQSIASLSASGGLAVDLLDTMGLDIQKLQIPVYMDHGIVKIAFAPGSAPPPATAPATGPADALTTTATCNGGTINLTGITLDLTAPTALLTIPPETKVLDNVAMNKVLAATANTYLPAFDESDANSGTLSFISHHCDRLPVEELTSETAAKNAGMDFSISFNNVQLGGKIVDAVEKLGLKDIRSNLRGDVPDARFNLGGGRLTIQNFKLLGGKNKLPVLKMTGYVGLSRDGLMNLVASAPPELLAKIPDKKLTEYLPETLDFPISGTKSAPRPALDKALQKALGQAGQKALLKGLGGSLFPGANRKPDPAPTTGPGGQ